MQKDIKPIQEQPYYQSGNQMIYSTQPLQPIQPDLSSQQASLMQGQMQTQGRPVYSNSAEPQPLHASATGRMPQYHGGTSYITSTYTQGPTTEVTSRFPTHSYHMQQPGQFMPNGNMQFQSYGNIKYAPRGSQFPPQPVYIVQPGNYASNVVLAQQMQSNPSHQIQNSQQQHMYPQMANVHSSPSAISMMPPPPAEQAAQPKKRPAIKLTDPNTGKDLTNEILAKKKEKAVVPPPAPNPDENIKAKTAALFAAKVAEKIAGSTHQPENPAEVEKDSEAAKTSADLAVVVPSAESTVVIEQDSSLMEGKDTVLVESLDAAAKDVPLVAEKVEETLTAAVEESYVLVKNPEVDVITDEDVIDNDDDVTGKETEKETNNQVVVEEETIVQTPEVALNTESEAAEQLISEPPKVEAAKPDVSETTNTEDRTEKKVEEVIKKVESMELQDQTAKKEEMKTEEKKDIEVKSENVTIKEDSKVVVDVPKEVSKENTEVADKKGSTSYPDDSKKIEKKELSKPKEAVTKEAASRRFEPAFSTKTEESLKSQVPSKPKDAPVKTAEHVVKKPEIKKKDSVETTTNGNDDSAKSSLNNVVKKKKGKSRYKDFDAKENNDMLSAFVDAPAEIAPEVPKATKVVEKPPEETTWEDKDIEKEDIRGEDAEEEVPVPKTVETKILKSEDPALDEKHQYDREFLLKFQFAPICTSKPANLPNIDIVLDEAHAPTKALIPGQRISAANDFMPTFMRQSSGGRNSSSGNRNNRDRKGGSQTGPSKPQKIIHAPQFEKVELKKTENAWVRPSSQTKDMSKEEKSLFEVNRAVTSILNKLTPQKFKPLVNQMIALKIDNSANLESAISLIFEKAISEPGFSVAYANMCRVLTNTFNSVPLSGGEAGQTVSFRKLLLNKCQTEFEKESSDEKQLTADRAKVFEKEEERKVHLAELDYREMQNRRRMLGNIRFIGELYKLKMISEPIMHDCIYKLLKAEKQDSLEDQLECLCKLLTTIGKDLDHQKAKPRMDQYFDQMEKVIEKRKISSRIKFALKDVIELRGCGWVPRRDDANPKTIDQIHREAEQKEKDEESSRQQDKIQRKLDHKGSRGGGRDSPSVRPPAGGGNAEGWNMVANKSRQMPTATVDVGKFKALKKTDASEISLGPGGRAGAWSKGASGGGISRSGSRSNTPTTEIDSRMNRYDVLTDSSVAPSALDNKRSGSRSLPPRKGMPGSHGGSGSQQGSRGGNRGDRDEQSAALRAVRDMTGRSSRSQSPATGRNSRNQSPAPPYDRGDNQQFSRPAAAAAPSITEDKMRKVTKSTIQEYLSCKIEKEAFECIQELQAPSLHGVFVEEAIILVIEKKAVDRTGLGSLLHAMLKKGIIDVPQICTGLTAVVSFAPDFSVDIPYIYKYIGEVLGPMVYDGLLPLNKVKDTLESLIRNSKAGIIMAEALSSAVSIAGKEDSIASLWQNSKLTWDMLIGSDYDVQDFIKDKKMEFTLSTPSSSASPHQPPQNTTGHSYMQSPTLSHASQIQENMLKILNDSQKNENSNENSELITYIEEHVSAENRKTASFIQVLTKTICSSSLIRGNQCECNKELLRRRKNILLKYIDRSKELELQALFALQQLVYELKQPRGLLHTLFNELYEGDIITEDAFFTWEKTKDFPLGKGPALSSVKDFLSWLKKADEESNDEESSPTATNVA